MEHTVSIIWIIPAAFAAAVVIGAYFLGREVERGGWVVVLNGSGDYGYPDVISGFQSEVEAADYADSLHAFDVVIVRARDRVR